VRLSLRMLKPAPEPLKFTQPRVVRRGQRGSNCGLCRWHCYLRLSTYKQASARRARWPL